MDALPENLSKITEKVIGCSYTVSNVLGIGFLEKVYENALTYELKKAGLNIVQQHPIRVQYDGVEVGEYVANLVVEEKVIVELKAVKLLDEAHAAQALNYLRATNLPVCLLINFGRPRIEIKRLIPSPAWKQPKPF